MANTSQKTQPQTKPQPEQASSALLALTRLLARQAAGEWLAKTHAEPGSPNEWSPR